MFSILGRIFTLFFVCVLRLTCESSESSRNLSTKSAAAACIVQQHSSSSAANALVSQLTNILQHSRTCFCCNDATAATTTTAAAASTATFEGWQYLLLYLQTRLYATTIYNLRARNTYKFIYNQWQLSHPPWHTHKHELKWDALLRWVKSVLASAIKKQAWLYKLLNTHPHTHKYCYVTWKA